MHNLKMYVPDENNRGGVMKPAPFDYDGLRR